MKLTLVNLYESSKYLYKHFTDISNNVLYIQNKRREVGFPP